MQVIGSVVAAGHQHPRRRLLRLRQQRLLQQQRLRRRLQRLQDLLQHPGRVRLHTSARVRQWCDNWRLIDASLLRVFVMNVNAMELKEFLKARRQIDAQQKQIEVLTAGLQKVNAQHYSNTHGRAVVIRNPLSF